MCLYPSAAQLLNPNCHVAPLLQVLQATAAKRAQAGGRRQVRLGWWAGEAGAGGKTVRRRQR